VGISPMAELPKQELLIKLLNMTTAEDNVALVAVRKANALLADAGWTWEQLLRGKITVVEDPFNNLGNPFAAAGPVSRPTTPPPQPARPRAPTPPPQPKPAFAQNIPFVGSNMNRIGIAPNKFLARCYCCGIEVPAQHGLWFRPDALNPAAPSKISVVCTPCSTTGTVYANPTGQRPAKQRGKADIHSLI
jgi:hypothetical protein